VPCAWQKGKAATPSIWRRCAKRGLSIETLCCDLAEYTPEPESVDLVVAIWMHLPPALLIEPEEPRSELEGLEWLVLQEQRRWALGRNPLA
jgi:hypothetical protein